MKKRWLVIIIVMIIGLAVLFIGVKLEQVALIHHHSTTICLSCMGLV